MGWRGSPQAQHGPTTAGWRWDGGSGTLSRWEVCDSQTTNMDILADYREWRDSREERIGTHSDRCHMRHEVCMIHRLARELERTRAALVAVAMQDGTLSVSDGRLFVDVDGAELAFDYAPPPHATPGEGISKARCTFTDAEREAIREAADAYAANDDDADCERIAKTLRALLERMT